MLGIRLVDVFASATRTWRPSPSPSPSHTPLSAWTKATIAAAGAAGTALGCAVGLTALARVDLRAETVGLATGSAGTVLATIAAALFLRRARRTGAPLDAVLTAAMTVMALASLAAAVIATTGGTAYGMPLHLPVSVGSGLVVAAAFAVAAFAPGQSLDDPGGSADRLFAGGVAGALTMVALTVTAFALTPEDSAIVAGDLLAAGLWIAAAVGFARRSRAGGPLTMLWLSVACAVLAVAQLNDALAPWSQTGHLSSGELIQVAGMVALVVAGMRDLEWEHLRRAETAVMEERQRLARELHDGLAQDLAYIASQAEDPRLAEVAANALEESRAAILALARPADEPLERVICDAAHSIGARSGVEVSVAVRPGIECATEVKHGLVRILREAMGNAIRHGRAGTVRVSVDGPSPLVMVVADDGAGFDPSARRRPDSLGLQSMHDRAQNLGGRLTIESSPGMGTSVAVVLS